MLLLRVTAKLEWSLQETAPRILNEWSHLGDLAVCEVTPENLVDQTRKPKATATHKLLNNWQEIQKTEESWQTWAAVEMCETNSVEVAVVLGGDFHGEAYLVTPMASRYWATVDGLGLTTCGLMRLVKPSCCWPATEMAPTFMSLSQHHFHIFCHLHQISYLRVDYKWSMTNRKQ